MPMALGGTRRAMALYGIPEWTRDGRHITMAIGLGSSRGAGLGSTMPPGASRPLTTAVGPTPVAVGAGYPVRWLSLQAGRRWLWSTRRRWSRSSAAAVGAPRFPSAVPPWAGCPWDRARGSEEHTSELQSLRH